MINQDFTIEKYIDKDKEQLLNVWEESVLATHNFLNPIDFEEIKKFLQMFDFNSIEVYCLKQNDEVVGFIGLAERKIEMLFLSPKYIGKSLGRKLIDFALSKLKANKVDVNEQNTNAVKFYEKIGFKVYEKTEKDDQGKEYPLLRMKLEPIKISGDEFLATSALPFLVASSSKAIAFSLFFLRKKE